MGAVLSVVSGIKANAIGVGGIPGILSIQPQYMGLFVAAMGLVILIPFCLTYAIGRKKGIGGGRRTKMSPAMKPAGRKGKLCKPANQGIKGICIR